MDDELMDYALERLRATRTQPARRCKICGGGSLPYDILDFNKSCASPAYPTTMSIVPVIYRLCQECGFIFTDFFDDFSSEQWRRYVYNDDYINVDPEYKLIRPRVNASMLRSFLLRPKRSVVGLDYGGGNGVTAALVRKQGWIYDCYDPFGYTNIVPERIGHYNFCSAIEVFEHSPDPVGSLRGILEKASRDRLIVLLSMGATDGAISNDTRLVWWYAAPRNGHVSLYSHKSLHILAEQAGLMCTVFRSPPFFFTRGFSEREVRRIIVQGKLRNLWHRVRRRCEIHKTTDAVTELD